MFTGIRIQDQSYKYFDSEDNLKKGIENLNKINIFVGQNNTGKSRFMRNLFSGSYQGQFNNQFNLTIWNKFTEDIENLINRYVSHKDNDINRINSIIKTNPIEHLDQDFNSVIGGLKTSFGTAQDIVNRFNNGAMKPQYRIDFFNEFNQIKSQIPDGYFEVNITNPKRIYIPLLRGLKNPIQGDEDCYKNRTVKDYPSITQQKDPIEVFTGLSLFVDVRKMLLGTHDQREKIKEYEIFLGEKFFNNETVTLTPMEGSDVIYIKIGDNPDYPIYDLGDGIQSIIIATFPLFKYKNEDIVLLIEEPEIGIHPGMQRILLDAFSKGINNQTGEHQIFMTTHSNHLLDIALDEKVAGVINIYQFQDKRSDGKHIANISQNKAILDLLGVRNSSVFLSNCIIWVEGVSDRIYIKKWIELYQNSLADTENFVRFEEDKHYSIIEYGGGNITHFNFGSPDEESTMNIEGVNKNNFIVADNDGFLNFLDESKDESTGIEEEEKKRIRLRELSKLLGDRFYADCPEIENLITFEQFQNYLNKYSGIRNKWELKSPIGDKADYESNIGSKDIGTILKDIFIQLKTGEVSKNFTRGTDISIIGAKGKIAERMMPYFTNFSELSPGAKELIEKIYIFIKENNT